MRQVPKYCLIGSGNMARHFAHYLTLLNIEYKLIPHQDLSTTLIQKHLLECTRLCILIKDSAIAEFISRYHLQNNPKIVHFSGSQIIPGCYSAHPLMTFGATLYTLAEYEALPFILEHEGPPFEALLPGLANNSFRIPQALKPFYHSMCVMSGNFSCMLWSKYFHELQTRFNIPFEDAKPYMERIFKNLAQNPGAALTGPLPRKDQKTIQENLNSLQCDSFLGIYQAFVETYQSQNPEDGHKV